MRLRKTPKEDTPPSSSVWVSELAKLSLERDVRTVIMSVHEFNGIFNEVDSSKPTTSKPSTQPIGWKIIQDIKHLRNVGLGEFLMFVFTTLIICVFIAAAYLGATGYNPSNNKSSTSETMR